MQAAIGDISESDVMLAEASDAVIIGFSVGIDKAAQSRADQSGVEIRRYDIIYKLIEDIEAALTGMLEPIYENQVIGHAQVLQLFKLRRGVIAGCSVTDGVVKRNALARVLRKDEVLVESTRIDTLRRFTEDVNEVRTGFECGIQTLRRRRSPARGRRHRDPGKDAGAVGASRTRTSHTSGDCARPRRSCPVRCGRRFLFQRGGYS